MALAIDGLLGSTAHRVSPPSDGKYRVSSGGDSGWAVSVSTGIGTPALPASHGQAVFEAAIFFLSIVLQAYTLGAATSALQNFDARSVTARQRLEDIRLYVRYRRVPEFLSEKILEYYEYALPPPAPHLAYT